MVLVAIGNIGELINAIGVTIWLTYGLVFGAAVIMRFTKSKEERPYKVLPLKWKSCSYSKCSIKSRFKYS